MDPLYYYLLWKMNIYLHLPYMSILTYQHPYPSILSPRLYYDFLIDLSHYHYHFEIKFTIPINIKLVLSINLIFVLTK